MIARIVAYTYASPDWIAYGVPPSFAATSDVGVIEQATPGTTTYDRPLVPLPFYAPEMATDQLRTWATNLSGSAPLGAPAGLYTATYSPTTKRVTISTTNGTAFRLVLPADAAVWTGFTQSLGSSYATSWTAASAPAAVCELLGVDVEPAEDASTVELHQYRHGRAVAIAWGNHSIHQVTLYLKADDLRVLDPGFLVTGRVRIYAGADTADYSETNPDGVLDGFVVASTDAEEDGDIGEVWTIRLLVALGG